MFRENQTNRKFIRNKKAIGGISMLNQSITTWYFYELSVLRPNERFSILAEETKITNIFANRSKLPGNV